MAGMSTKRPRENDGNADHRPAKRSNHDYTRTISVLIGDDEIPFMVHVDVICAKSKFFRAACSKRWKEGQEKIVRLPDVISKTFERYVGWVYSDDLMAETRVSDTLDMMIDLWLLGDVLDDVSIRNKTLMALNSYGFFDQRQPSTPPRIAKIWASTTPGSPLREWALDAVALRYAWSHYERHLLDYTMEFVQQLSLKMMQQRKTATNAEWREKAQHHLESGDNAQ